MALTRLTVRDFRATFSRLVEPTLVGDGIWFPTSTPILEGIAESGDRVISIAVTSTVSGEGSPKTPPSGEGETKGPAMDEAPPVATVTPAATPTPTVPPSPDASLARRSSTEQARAIMAAQQRARDEILQRAFGSKKERPG